MVDSSKYLVLDVETNGLSAVRDDLLSISLYMPDKNKFYDRFLPLEKNSQILTRDINGITKKMLKGKKPLSQNEVDTLVDEYEIEQRIILCYGGLDEKFIRKYFAEHDLSGIEKWNFFNFKHNIISSRFDAGIATKDNLCEFFNIEGVQDVHSGHNDCILEWKLFERLDNNSIFIICPYVFLFNKDYIVPASYLKKYTNLKYHINSKKIDISSQVVKRFEIECPGVKKFMTNFNGILIEQAINSNLNVVEQNNMPFLIANKAQMKCLGRIHSPINEIEYRIMPDGTISLYGSEHRKLEKEINKNLVILKESMQSLTDYLRNEILKSDEIETQEMVVNKNDNVLALCDLSSESAVVEIKTYTVDNWDDYKYQLYYQANGRDVYCLTTKWWKLRDNILIFELNKINFEKQEKLTQLQKAQIEFEKKLTNPNIKIVKFNGSKKASVFKCMKCNKEFNKYTRLQLVKCPGCNEKGVLDK